MKLPNFKRIYKTDFPGDIQDTIERLAQSINDGFDKLYDAMNKKVSIRDNIQCTVKEIDVTARDANGNLSSPISFALETQGRAEGVTAIKADNLTNPTGYPDKGLHVSFTQTGSTLTITNITGLLANNLYRVKLIVYG